MSDSIFRIEAMAMVAGKAVHFDVLFNDRSEADKACSFLRKVEGIVHLEYTGIQPITFEDFKDKLGEQFDVIEEEVSFSRIKTANTVAA